LLLFGGLTLLLAICIQYVLPQWSVYGIQFLQENLLVVGTVVLLLLFLFVWKVPKWQVAHITDEKDRLTTESGFRQTLVQLVGGAALLGGLYFTAQTLRTSQETLRVNQKTLETTQQGQITERFTKAVEQLGNKEQLTIRLGGIYALEQVAKDSDSHYWAVMEVLTAFVREQAPVTALPPDKTSGERETKERPHERKLPSDIQAILTVIGRRTRTYGKGGPKRLDLSYTNLQNATLSGTQLQDVFLLGAQLQGAYLGGAQLQAAWLEKAQLQAATLSGTQLQDANLRYAQLRSANLWYAQLRSATMKDAQLQGADLRGAQLQRAQLQGADLTAVKNLTQDQIDTACLDEHTQLPEGLTRPTPCHTPP
jgi:Pentapeptide repeats (8 copies)